MRPLSVVFHKHILPTVSSHHNSYMYMYICAFAKVADVKGSLLLLSVSELLMGEVDSSTLLSLLPTEKSRVSVSTTSHVHI